MPSNVLCTQKGGENWSTWSWGVGNLAKGDTWGQKVLNFFVPVIKGLWMHWRKCLSYVFSKGLPREGSLRENGALRWCLEKCRVHSDMLAEVSEDQGTSWKPWRKQHAGAPSAKRDETVLKLDNISLTKTPGSSPVAYETWLVPVRGHSTIRLVFLGLKQWHFGRG